MKLIEDELGAANLKSFHLDYNLKEMDEKCNTFLPSDSIVIRNLPIPQQGDEVSCGKMIDDLDEDLPKVEWKGQVNGKLGSVFLKFSIKEAKN